MKYHFILLITALMTLPSVHINAEDTREVTWDDLVPAELDFDDPFEKLYEDQLYNLALIARYREQKSNKDKSLDFTQAEYDEAMSKLKADSIDVDGLIARREEITEKRRAQGQTPNAELNGKKIRLPGYLLPLEFEDKKVTEFLLVPWVGACIHTPPPPPNQIVHVKLAKGFDIGDEVFTAVWVNGVMKTEKNNPELSFVDGKQNVDVSYVMQAEAVELYDE
jgi:hypothetical protein